MPQTPATAKTIFANFMCAFLTRALVAAAPADGTAWITVWLSVTPDGTKKNARRCDASGVFVSITAAATYSPTPVSRAALFLHARCRARSGGSAADGTARETVWRSAAAVQTKTPQTGRFCLYYCRQRPTLPHSFPCSTIGGIRLNFRVRNGNGCDPDPMTTGILAAWGPAVARFRELWRAGFAACPP